MYQLQNIDYLYRISTMTGSSKLVTVQADRDSHDLNGKHFVMLNMCRAIVNFANEGHVISACMNWNLTGPPSGLPIADCRNTRKHSKTLNRM